MEVIDMTLGQVIVEIRVAYQRAYESVQEYIYLDEVSSFISRRKKDLDEFERITACYSKAKDIVEIQQDLRERGFESKVYGGICLQKADYFSVTKKVQKAIKKEIEEQLYTEEKEPVVNYDKDYAIFDEFSNAEAEELCEA